MTLLVPPARALTLSLAACLLSTALSTTSPLAPAASAAVAAGPGDFVGIDGARHEPAPNAVPGLDGQQFRGVDLDIACHLGPKLKRSMRRVTALTRVIERSGRRVVWTVGPSKATALPQSIDPATLPHGECDQAGLRAQRHLLDTYQRQDPAFLPVRRRLATAHDKVYYLEDLHWTTVGASLFTKALATRLDPALGRRQTYEHVSAGSDPQLAAFLAALGLAGVAEPAPTALPQVDVQVHTARGSTPWSGPGEITFDHAWRSTPSKRTWPGRTVLLGDSFMFGALLTMRPVFRQGRFVWVEHARRQSVVDAIRASDTVVIEVLQTYLPLGQKITSPGFLRDVRRTLRRG